MSQHEGSVMILQLAVDLRTRVASKCIKPWTILKCQSTAVSLKVA